MAGDRWTLCPRERQTAAGLIEQRAVHLRASRLGLTLLPRTEASPGLGAEFAALDLLDQHRMRLGGVIERRHHDLMDLVGEVEPAEIRLLERAKYTQPRAKALFDDRVERVDVADSGVYERDRFALERMLQAVADESRDVSADVDRTHAAAGEQLDRPVDVADVGLIGLHDLHERNEVRWMPEVCAQHALRRVDQFGDRSYWDR